MTAHGLGAAVLDEFTTMDAASDRAAVRPLDAGTRSHVHLNRNRDVARSRYVLALEEELLALLRARAAPWEADRLAAWNRPGRHGSSVSSGIVPARIRCRCGLSRKNAGLPGEGMKLSREIYIIMRNRNFEAWTVTSTSDPLWRIVRLRVRRVAEAAPGLATEPARTAGCPPKPAVPSR